jgi:hypothetical protein
MGIGLVLGGALTGLGSAMVEKAKIDMTTQAEEARVAAKAKYDAMIEQLKHGNTLDEQTHKGAVDVATESGKLAAAEPYKVADDNRTMARDKTIEGMREASAKDLARLNGAISQSNTAAAEKLRSDLESGKGQVVSSGDGYVHIVYKDGTSVNTGVPAEPVKATSVDQLGTPSTVLSPTKPTMTPAPRTAAPTPPAQKALQPADKAKRPPLSAFQR